MWLARRRRELAIARQATDRLRRRARRVVIISLRRVPFVRRLPCLRPPRRKNKRVDLTEDVVILDGGGGDGVDGDASVRKEGGGVQTGEDRGEVGGRGKGNVGRGEGSVDNDNIRVWTPPTVKNTYIYGDGTRRRLARNGAEAAAAAAVAEGGAAKAGNRKDELARRRHAAAGPSLLAEHLRRRKKACMGMEEALQAEKEAFANAGQEYVFALSDFESDHSLEITW